MTKISRFSMLLSLCVLASCKQTIPPDGFAKLKFGMTSAELRPLGFACGPNDTDCSQIDEPPTTAKASLFDKPVRLSATMHDDRLTEITVYVPNYDEDELIDMLVNSYGEPKRCRFSNPLGASVERAVWTASNGASIAVHKLLRSGIAPQLAGLSGLSSAATYRDPTESKSWREQTC